jgi:hypothetical protein
MTAKEHYDTHLGYVYSWMLGDFAQKMSEQMDFSAIMEFSPQVIGWPLIWVLATVFNL